MTTTDRPNIAAGDAILHPVALAAVAVLLINDHLLKVTFPGLVTGKLSDVAGLVFFPILLLGGWEVLQLALRRWAGPTARPLAASICVSAAGFALVKTVPAAADAFGAALGLGQWLPSAALSILARRDVGSPASAAVVVDLTDLLALPALLVPAMVGRARIPGRDPLITERRGRA